MSMESGSPNRNDRIRHWSGTQRTRGARALGRYRLRLSTRTTETRERTSHAGPYESAYDVCRGYAMERQILRP